MPGSKTRPGFFAGGEAPASKPDEDSSPRAARTVIGHEMHLRTPLAPRPAAQAPPPPGETSVPEAIPDETTDQLPPRPSHTGKSKFPAFARLLGRWTTGGGFLARSGIFGGADDLPRVPRDPWVSRIAIFAVAALFSFLVALAVLKLHRCGETGSPPSGTTRASATPAPPAPTTAEAAPAPPPTPSAPPGLPSAAAASDVPVAQPLAVRPKATHQPMRRTVGPLSRTAPSERGNLRGQRPLAPTKTTDSLLPLGM